MKKFLSFLLSVVLIVTMNMVAVIPVLAFSSLGFTYTLSGTEATIIGYTGTDVNINIPSSLDGYSVTSISSKAFYNRTIIISVIISDSVTTIGASAFYGCSKMTSINIGNGVTKIDNSAFYNCTSLNNVALGNNVVEIGDSSFYSCPLTSLTIPESVTKIGSLAFRGSNFSSVNIPAGVSSIGSGSFSACNNLMQIVVDADNTNYKSVDGILFDKLLTCIIQYPAGIIGEYLIPTSVYEIRAFSFDGCKNLSNIIIGSQVNIIGT